MTVQPVISEGAKAHSLYPAGIRSLAQTIPATSRIGKSPLRRRLDAVFIPCRNRAKNLASLLNDLLWLDAPIFVIPSSDRDIELLDSKHRARIERLPVSPPEVREYLRGLRTTRHRFAARDWTSWDLSLKRSAALLFARRRSYSSILFLDDDIRSITESTVLNGVTSLERFPLGGCFIEGFPDTSVLGHLLRVVGLPEPTFLSGSFLFVDPQQTRAFFPAIYNEDWLFMLPHLLAKEVCAVGAVTQLPYDPFRTSARAAFEEFGDLIVDALFSLVLDGGYDRRHSLAFWADALAERHGLLTSLVGNTSLTRDQLRSAQAALRVCVGVWPTDCVDFVEGWEQDLEAWRAFTD